MNYTSVGWVGVKKWLKTKYGFKLRLLGIIHGHTLFETHSLILVGLTTNHLKPCPYFIYKNDTLLRY
jgi:hypothetical protein